MKINYDIDWTHQLTGAPIPPILSVLWVFGASTRITVAAIRSETIFGGCAFLFLFLGDHAMWKLKSENGVLVLYWRLILHFVSGDNVRISKLNSRKKSSLVHHHQ